MKITFIAPFNEFTGGMKVIRQYAEKLNRFGHDCQIWYPWRRNPRGIRNYFSHTHAYLHERQIPDADVIIATAWETAETVYRQPERKGRKHYFIQHYEQWDVWNHLYEADKYRRQEVDDTYFLPMKHIIVSKFIRSMLPVQRPDDVVIHNGLDLHLVGRVVKDWHTPRILAYCGGPKWKGSETYYKALEIVEKKYPDIYADSYGSGERLTDEELKQKMLKANIFVFPSWIEGFGLPPLEAAYYGCAIVSTTTNAMPEILGKRAIFVPPNDAMALAEGMIKAIEMDPTNRQLMGECCMREARLHTLFDSTIKFWEALE